MNLFYFIIKYKVKHFILDWYVRSRKENTIQYQLYECIWTCKFMSRMWLSHACTNVEITFIAIVELFFKFMCIHHVKNGFRDFIYVCFPLNCEKVKLIFAHIGNPWSSLKLSLEHLTQCKNKTTTKPWNMFLALHKYVISGQ